MSTIAIAAVWYFRVDDYNGFNKAIVCLYYVVSGY